MYPSSFAHLKNDYSLPTGEVVAPTRAARASAEASGQSARRSPSDCVALALARPAPVTSLRVT